MPLPEWREEQLGRRHDRDSFDCGVPELNTYLKKYARQNQEAGVSLTTVAISKKDPKQILGYYSLAPVSISLDKVPKLLKKRLPEYPIPGYRLARLAVDARFQRVGLGGQLLLGAGERCLAAAAEVGGLFMVIDAKDENAATWYERFGAVRSEMNDLMLLLPLNLIHEVISKFRKGI